MDDPWLRVPLMAYYDRRYEPASFESVWQKRWQETGLFAAEVELLPQLGALGFTTT